MKIDKKKIRIALAENDMTQTELAVKLGIKQPSLSNMITRRNPKYETVERIANALGKKVEDIVTEEYR